MSGIDGVFFVGGAEGGTRLLQAALATRRAQLRQRGIRYLDDSTLDGFAHLAGWRASPRPVPDEALAFEHELAAAVGAEPGGMGRRDPGVLVLAAERLLGLASIGRRDRAQFRPCAVPALTQVIQALGLSAVRLVVQTRRQDRLMERSYVREIEAGHHHRFVHQFPYRTKPALDYGELLERLAGVPGVADVVVRPVEIAAAGAAVAVRDLLTVAGLPTDLDLDAACDGLTDRNYSYRGVKVARGMNPHVKTAEDRALVRDYVLRRFGADGGDHARIIRPEQRAAILAAYGGANREVFRRYLPGLPEDSYAGDEQTERMVRLAAERLPPAPRPVAGTRAALRRLAPRRRRPPWRRD